MTAQPNQGNIFAAPAAIQIRRRPCALSMSQLTWSPSFGPVAVPMSNRELVGDPRATTLPSGWSRT